MSSPCVQHLQAAKQVLKYLSGTKQLCLKYTSTGEELNAFMTQIGRENSQERVKQDMCSRWLEAQLAGTAKLNQP